MWDEIYNITGKPPIYTGGDEYRDKYIGALGAALSSTLAKPPAVVVGAIPADTPHRSGGGPGHAMKTASTVEADLRRLFAATPLVGRTPTLDYMRAKEIEKIEEAEEAAEGKRKKKEKAKPKSRSSPKPKRKSRVKKGKGEFDINDYLIE